LCADPQGMLGRMFAHAHLSADSAWIAKMAQRIRAPTYYDLPFGEPERATIRQLTAKAAERLGYRSDTGHCAVA
jgi:hypothetical protein